MLFCPLSRETIVSSADEHGGDGMGHQLFFLGEHVGFEDDGGSARVVNMRLGVNRFADFGVAYEVRRDALGDDLRADGATGDAEDIVYESRQRAAVQTADEIRQRLGDGHMAFRHALSCVVDDDTAELDERIALLVDCLQDWKGDFPIHGILPFGLFLVIFC